MQVGLLLLLCAFFPVPASGAGILPPEDIALNHVHVQFGWQPVGPTERTVVLIPSQDSWLHKKSPTTNFGAESTLSVDGEESRLHRTLVQFDLSAIAAGTPIISATLSMERVGGGDSSVSISAHNLTQAWTELGATWRHYDGINPWIASGADFDPTAEAATSVASNGVYDWDLAALVQDWVDGIEGNAGILLKQNPELTGDQPNHDFGARESGTPPTLTVTYLSSGPQSYQLVIVEDDASPAPFASGAPVVDLVVGASEPRTVVTSGLEFGRSYAWRVRGNDDGPLPWGPTHRFSTAPLPAYLPGITVVPGTGTMEPGLTLFNVNSQNGSIPGGLALAVDAAGDPVWFATADDAITDIRQLDNGRMLFLTRADRGFETTLNGQVTWASPDDSSLLAHHEIFPMPNGNFLTLVYELQQVFHNNEFQTWAASRAVEIDRTNNQIVWSWDPFDYYSLLDFDVSGMVSPGVGGSNLPAEIYDWTHENAVIYVPSQNSVYVSPRRLSRITRIDYATGDIIYEMGFTMPSGDPDFGDNLFSYQHAPELLPNGNMMVYDNGSRKDHIDQTPATGVTKALELAFTGEPPTDAAIVWEYTQPEYSAFVGDADRLPGGNTLVTSGPAGKLYEVDASGAEVWRMELSSGLPDYFIYRAERIPALIVDVSADTDGDGLLDEIDNCPDHVNPLQDDCNLDGFGDVCALALGLRVCLPTECEDSVDNDGDGLIDLGDPGCDNAADVSEESPSLVCDDGLDNDADGLFDFPNDIGCTSPTDSSEHPECSDGFDNDGDLLTDHPSDPGCRNADFHREDPECDDGIDNDGDLLTDHPADPGCAERWTVDESPACSDGVDNDGDGLIDYPQDRACQSPSGTFERRGCGLGAELVILLPLLTWLSARRDGPGSALSIRRPPRPGSKLRKL